jgi:hypothetical protein
MSLLWEWVRSLGTELVIGEWMVIRQVWLPWFALLLLLSPYDLSSAYSYYEMPSTMS